MNIAVSSWALHRTLGVSYPSSPSSGSQGMHRHQPSWMELTELPMKLNHHGFHTLELCHFHLPSVHPDYVSEFRSALESADVRLQSLLIDEGDISDADHGERDARWIEEWIRVAGALGAERARVIAGKHPYTEDSFERSLTHLDALATVAQEVDVRLTTENWYPLLATPEAVNDALDRLGGRLGLCADFGNWPTSSKYEDLPRIFARAETCHAKCEFLDAETIDRVDYRRCLAIAKEAKFSGTYVLVNGGPDDEWHALDLSRDAILEA